MNSDAELEALLTRFRAALGRIQHPSRRALVAGVIDDAILNAERVAREAAGVTPEKAFRGLIDSIRVTSRAAAALASSFRDMAGGLQPPLRGAVIRYVDLTIDYARGTDEMCAALEEAIPTASPEWLRRFLDSLGQGGSPS